MTAAFPARFPLSARAPGRVNLIGEHTDYNDLPVFPRALQRAVEVRFAPRDDARVRLVNASPEFGPREFEVSESIAPFGQGDWGNYAKAAAQALAREHGARRGFDARVSGDLPEAAGLSSSAALVVACGLAFAASNEISLPPLELADVMARAEVYVGTRSGGMDQAACIAGRAGHALKIDFAPLRVEAIALPHDWRFVVAHSLVLADKAGAAREAYNARRSDCERALEMLVSRGELAGEPGSYPELLARHRAEKLVEVGTRELEPRLLARFRHVIGEAARVAEARVAMLADDAARFGSLMDASHASLARDYEVSHRELDVLVEIARTCGALGARLTGAGFGGCAVALVPERDVERVVAGLRERFYASRAVPASIPEPLLVAVASDGARVSRLDS
jgi:galactokinase